MKHCERPFFDILKIYNEFGKEIKFDLQTPWRNSCLKKVWAQYTSPPLGLSDANKNFSINNCYTLCNPKKVWLMIETGLIS